VEVTALPNAPFGDYSIKLQANSGETAFVPGALTIDPGVVSSLSNPVDDYRFFLTQHFTDLLGRQPDQEILEKLRRNFRNVVLAGTVCGPDDLTLLLRFLPKMNLPTTGLFLQTLYSVGLGRRPRLTEYESDRKEIRNYNGGIEDARLALVQAFVQRLEFDQKYPKSLTKTEFVDRILSSVSQSTDLDLKNQREALLGLSDGTSAGRAAILQRFRAVKGPRFGVQPGIRSRPVLWLPST
jgi:hypothetical protein